MIGVLSTNGSSVTLSDSGLVLSASEVSADDSLRGSVVRVTVSANKLYCYALDSKSGKVDMEENTSGSYKTVSSVAKLYSATDVDDADFFVENGQWYALVKECKIPVNGLAEVYIPSVGKWYSGEEGLLTAISSGLDLTVYYDRTLTTGAQARMIVAK